MSTSGFTSRVDPLILLFLHLNAQQASKTTARVVTKTAIVMSTDFGTLVCPVAVGPAVLKAVVEEL